MPEIDTTNLEHLHVAVTGASGFLGRHLVRTLLARNARVTLLQRPGASALPAHAALPGHPVDFGDIHVLSGTLKSFSPTHIIHLAGFANSDRSVDAIEKSLTVNLLAAMKMVLAAMDTTPDTRVVTSGSLETANPWKESLALGSPYGMSKAMLEVLTGGLHQLYEANVINVRIGMTYGPDDPNGHRLVPSVIDALLAGRAPQIGSGGRRCDWIHVDDVVEALIHAALLPPTAGASMDAGSGVLTSVHDVAELIHDEIGTAIPIEYVDALNRPHEQERTAEADAVAAATGWRSRISLPDGIAQTVRWHRDQGAARP